MLNKNNVAELLYQQINNLKQIGKDDNNNKMHIVLMTNETDSFDEFEYTYQETQENEKRNKIANILSSAIASFKKKLDEPKYKKELKPEKLQRIKSLLKQYELIKNIILTLIEKNYTYISYVYGGYKSIHDLCLKYNINILNHKQNNCYLCRNKYLEDEENNSNEPKYKIINKTRDYHYNLVRRFIDPQRKKSDNKNEAESNKSDLKNRILEQIPVNEMNVYLANKENKIYHCLLVWHNMNELNDKIILIVFENNIQMFKMNVKKEGIFFDVIEKIGFENIKDIKRDKNIFNLYYKTGDKNNDLKIDTFTDNDGESFYQIFKGILEKNKKEINSTDN
jgi:hypothetical protein